MDAFNGSATLKKLIAQVSTKLDNSLIISLLSVRKLKLATLHYAVNLNIDLGL